MNGPGDPVTRRPSARTRPSASSGAQAPVPQVRKPDQFYGHEDTARICAAYVSSTFSCPEIPPSSTAVPNPQQPPPPPPPPLANFIAYALHRTRLHSCVTFTALYLLARLKARFPAARGSSGHRLFISAFMIASKVVCDDTYSNKSWCVVGQGMFSLKEINQMEREMCSYLEWKLNFDPAELASFEARVRREFAPDARPRSVQVPAAVVPLATPPVQVSASSSSLPRRTSYPSPPDSPTTPLTANPSNPAASLQRTQQMTPPDSSRSSTYSANSTFSAAPSAASSATSLASTVPSVQKPEPGYAYVSRSVW